MNDQRVEEVLVRNQKLNVAQLHEVLTGLDIAEKPKPKAKIFDKIRQVIHHQMESHARASAAGGVQVPTAPVNG